MPEEQDLLHCLVSQSIPDPLISFIVMEYQIPDAIYFSFGLIRSPETASVRNKMVYAASKDKFRRELDGVQVELQATDPSEMSLDIFKGRAH